MKKIFVSILLSGVLALTTFAQIGQEIKAYVDSTELIVNNGRKMLLKKIAEKDNLKVKEIYDYLSEITHKKDYSAFHYTEELYINLLICDWFKLSQLMLEYTNEYNKITYPNSYPITGILYESIVSSSDSLLSENQKVVEDIETKSINELLIHLLKVGHVNNDYNEELKTFQRDFNPSKYTVFLKNYMPRVRVKASFAWSLGSGMVITTGKLANNYKSNASINMSMDINIEKLFTSLYLNASGLKLKEPFSATLNSEVITFNRNESFHYLDAGLKGGYFFIRNERFHVAPYLSISGSFLESKRFDPEDNEKEYQVFNSFTYGGGLHTEVKIKDLSYTNIYGYAQRSYISLKMEGGYNVIAKFNDNLSKGNTPYFTVAFVWGFGEF